MPTKSTSETKRRRYLLGLSSPDEREHIESDYFEDEAVFAEMLTAEDDLIDAYARGELPDEERQRFENFFLSSLPTRDRVQFARAFAGVVSASSSVATERSVTVLDIFTNFRLPGLSRTAKIAAVIVLIAMLAFLIIDRMRMSDELRELRAESVRLSKRTEVLQRSSDTERARRSTTHEGEVPGSRADQTKVALDGVSIETRNAFSRIPDNMSDGGATLRGSISDPNGNLVSGAHVTLTDRKNFTRTQTTNKHGVYVFNAIPPGTYSIEVTARGFKTASASGLTALVDTPRVRDVQLEIGAVSATVDVTSAAESSINASDASLGNSFERKRITELPLNANNVVNLLTLEPSVWVAGAAIGGRAEQWNITLDGHGGTVRISNSRSWVRFQLILKTAPIHQAYQLTIKTAEGRLVTFVDWIEPLLPNQTVLDTPVISTADLPSGDYVLLLMGEESDGSFVKVAEYSFKVIKYL